MISRIRLEAFGATADDVVRTLHLRADELEKILGVAVTRGEEVIERDTNEPQGGTFAYKGRLILHPDIQHAIRESARGPVIDFTLNGVGSAGTGLA